MKISELIKELSNIKEEYGDIKVTCTGSTDYDSISPLDNRPFETTVETLVIRKDGKLGARVRLYL